MNRFNAHLISPYAKTRNRPRPIRSFSLATTAMWLILGASLACESSGDDDSTTTTTVPADENNTSEGSESAGVASETGQSTTAESEGSGTESSDTGMLPTNPCLPNPNFLCNMPYDCISGPNRWVCGALNSPLDEQGCLRPRCLSHQDCAIGEKCFNDYRCNEDGCTASNMICRSHSRSTSEEKLGGPCECSGADDCSSEIGWCVSEAIYDCPLEEATDTSTTVGSSSTTMDTTDGSSGGTSDTSETTGTSETTK